MMRRARYTFKPGVKYFSWVVAVKVLELPCYGCTRRAVKVTLATPYVPHERDGEEKLVASEKWEAIVWLFPDDEEHDREFIADAGIISSGEQFLIPKWKSIRIWCVFGAAEGVSKYQPLERYEVIAPGKYPIEPEIIATRSSVGLEFLPNGTVRWRRKKVSLPQIQIQILKELDRCYPERVPPERLKQVVTKWSNLTMDRTVEVAVNELKQSLPRGLSISRRDGVNGWSLIADNS